MSSSIRNNNLFSTEDYKKIFKSFAFIDYKAYDFDTLKQALVNYIQIYYPEDFNDYIQSSEFVAIIELIAYLGTSLAFRTDLNSRENFIDTAERRESIIRLAQMVNYVPRRNVAASGLFKIAAVQTNQPLVDANGININDLTIYWNDPNNPDWFDQFVQICNSAFSSINPFGRPTKSGTIGNIPTDLYQMNSLTMQTVTYPINVTINGQQFPVDICNPDFVTNTTIFERKPDPKNAFNFIYRNDSLGVSSANTGFFLYFKQGNLVNFDYNFEFPVPNRLVQVGVQNINQDDVYVQETDQNGIVVNHWAKVPALAGENIIYNSIKYSERNIFDVISGANDTITVRFADGNFGNVPTGLFRLWTRISANQALVIRPDNVQGMQIAIPYIGSDGQQYTMRIIFNLEQTIGNASPAETDEQIKLRAPEVFSTQSRMVNGSDYNVLPLIYGNQISKIQSINRTNSGQSRYIDLNDPTGFHRDLIIFGQDGALYRDNQNITAEVISNSANVLTIQQILVNTIQGLLRDSKVTTFFYDEYLRQFESLIRVNQWAGAANGYSLLDLKNDSPYGTPLYWRTSPTKFKNATGYFVNTIGSTTAVSLENNFALTDLATGIYNSYGFIKAGAVLKFESTNITTPVNSVIQLGIPENVDPLNPYANIGPVDLNLEIQDNAQATKVYPVFRSDLNSAEVAEVVSAIDGGISFWLYYDLIKDEWHTSTAVTPGVVNQSDQAFVYAAPNVNSIYSNWAAYPASGILYVDVINSNQLSTTTYDITARGRIYVFESYRDVRFYWEPNRVVVDNATGQALQDVIEIMPLVNTNNSINNNDPIIVDPTSAFLREPIYFNITGVYTQDDGYTDNSKVKVSLVDINSDGIPDDPFGFSNLVSTDDRIVFEYYRSAATGYSSTRPWVSAWVTSLENTVTDLYVYFPVNLNDITTLYSAPFIANMQVIDQYNPTLTPGAIVVYLDNADLIFINNAQQLAFNGVLPVISIANQVTAFFNNDNSTYSWINGISAVSNKTDIITNYFLSKSFLLSSLPGSGIFKSLEFVASSNLNSYPSGKIVDSATDKYHYDRNGKVFTQNLSIAQHIPMYFKWNHVSPIDQRVDPASTNIIDMVVITYGYYVDMLNWKNNNGTTANMPDMPTTEELRIQFQDLDQYKMVSDSMIWNSGQFKILFGTQAPSELRATFKVVKSQSSTVSDNEVKTLVVEAIDAYFDIRNWDFGETFFYTELAAFIHQQMSRIISSIVIVPDNANSQFGNLFEIVANPNQLFMSTATVDNVIIVAALTEQNMRA